MSTRDSVPLSEGDDRFLTGAARGAESLVGRVPPGPVLFDEDWRRACLNMSPAETEPKSYFCTFTCYGTWLHGDVRGSIDVNHDEWLTPTLEPDEERERREFELLKHAPVKLGPRQRTIVHATLIEVCKHRGWRLHALNVRTNHVHAVVTANRKGKRVLNDFKSYATRRMKDAECLPEACLEVIPPPSRQPSSRDREEAVSHGAPIDNHFLTGAARNSDPQPKFKAWTRGGSARPIKSDEAFRRAIDYTLNEQGRDITPGGGKAGR